MRNYPWKEITKRITVRMATRNKLETVKYPTNRTTKEFFHLRKLNNIFLKVLEQ